MLMCFFWNQFLHRLKRNTHFPHVFLYFGRRIANTPCFFLSTRLYWRNLHTRLRIGSSKPFLTDKTRILACANIVESRATSIFTPQKTVLLIIFIYSRVGASKFKCGKVLRKHITVLWLCESEDIENHWRRQQLQNNLSVWNGMTFVIWKQISITNANDSV
jgi:hypothetical protein